MGNVIPLFRILAVVIIALGLSNCAGMHSKFNCNATGGINGCATLGHVNRMANHGLFKRMQANLGSPYRNQNKLDNIVLSHPTGFPVSALQAGEPLRSQSLVQNVWIAPYQPKSDVYIWPTMASIVVHHSHWLGQKIKAIKESAAS